MNLDKLNLIKDVHLFMRKLCLKTLYHKNESLDHGIEVVQSLSKGECRALKELSGSGMDLLLSPQPSTPL